MLSRERGLRTILRVATTVAFNQNKIKTMIVFKCEILIRSIKYVNICLYRIKPIYPLSRGKHAT